MVWLLTLAGIYLAVSLLVFFMQERLIFIGAYFSTRAVDRLEGVEIERLALDDGSEFRIAHGRPEHDARGVIVSFVGNGEDLSSGVHYAALWRNYGFESIVVEYPGYGDSDGSPGIGPILAAARRAGDVAHARSVELGVPFVAAGVSLGTFSAVRVAHDLPVARLVLSAPPTSLVAAGRDRFPWLPIGLLLRHRFDSLALAPSIGCPVWIVHGDRDHVVPQAMGRELAQAFIGPVEFVDATGYDHMIPLHRHGPFGESLNSFLAGK